MAGSGGTDDWVSFGRKWEKLHNHNVVSGEEPLVAPNLACPQSISEFVEFTSSYLRVCFSSSNFEIAVPCRQQQPRST